MTPSFAPSLADAATILTGACADTDPVSVAAAVMRIRSMLASVEYVIADARPALTVAEVADNYQDDPETRAEVSAWRDRYDFADVSELPAHDDGGDSAWTIEAGGSDRYEVREVPRYSPSADGYADEVDRVYYPRDQFDSEVESGDIDPAETCYLVWDTSDDCPADRGYRGHLSDVGREDYDPTDEDAATEAADAANLRDYEDNACGFPFAHNYAAAIGDFEVAHFVAAGFVVARYRGGQLYAGIDGGGYDFLGSHWLRAFLATQTAHGPGYVRTRDGVRKVVSG